MEDLIGRVARRAGVDHAQAEQAIAEVLAHLTANLPSPLVGRIHELLRAGTPAQNPPSTAPPP